MVAMVAFQLSLLFVSRWGAVFQYCFPDMKTGLSLLVGLVGANLPLASIPSHFALISAAVFTL